MENETNIGNIVVEEESNIGEIELDVVPTVTSKHNELTNRDLANQHPISAITGLQDILDNIEGKYVKTFTSSDWALNGAKYEITIPVSEYKLGNAYVSEMEMLENNNYLAVTMFGSEKLPNDTIIIKSDLIYDGKLIVKGDL